MVLMNTAPASYGDYLLLKDERARRITLHAEKLNALRSSSEFEADDPRCVAEYYRTIFGSTIKRPEHLERLNLNWTREDILRGRAIENRLMEGLFWTAGFTILPHLSQLRTSTLVMHGDYDFIPIQCAINITDAIPGARLAVLANCGHFAYIEAADEVRQVMADFFAAQSLWQTTNERLIY